MIPFLLNLLIELYEPLDCITTLQAQPDRPSILSSPGFPERYPDNAECTWTIQAAPGNYVQLEITHIDIEGQGATCYDSVEVGLFDISPKKIDSLSQHLFYKMAMCYVFF